ncbi:hypothetical protein ACTFSP_23830 [Bacillus cereus group sp. MYBK108-2]|nr:hypothetical protein [Bacillus cereus]MDA2496789.1 hypothetical protein [Bacillus cereus]HEF1899650.1 hypothetical protein [Bacillus cereus]
MGYLQIVGGEYLTLTIKIFIFLLRMTHYLFDKLLNKMNSSWGSTTHPST